MTRRLVPAALAGGALAFAAVVTAGAIGHAADSHHPYQYDYRSEPVAAIDALGGQSTTVTLDPSTAAVLQQNGVTVAPVAPATVSTTNGVAVTFPITGGEAYVFPTSDLPFVRGTLTHSGGLTFSGGGKSLTVTNFIIDPSTSILTATVGTSGTTVPLFELDGQNVKLGADAAGHPVLDGTIVRLSPTAAAALNQTFGVSLFKEGIPVGTAHIVLSPAGGASSSASSAGAAATSATSSNS